MAERIRLPACLRKTIRCPGVKISFMRLTGSWFAPQGPQELLLTGMRTSGELLMIRMVRAEQRRAQIHIVFKDSKNRTFVSSSCGRNANSEACRVLTLDISQGKTFQVSFLLLLKLLLNITLFI